MTKGFSLGDFNVNQQAADGASSKKFNLGLFMSRMVDKLSVKEKYRLYETAVQCFESDIEFLKENYKN